MIVAHSGAEGLRQLPAGSAYSSEVAIGSCGPALCADWTEEGTTLLATITPDSGTPPRYDRLDLGVARGGSLAFVAAPFALVLARTARTMEGEPFPAESVLVSPGFAPVEIAGLLHSVASNGNIMASSEAPVCTFSGGS
ncbi:MAG TPA: hypothetical protein VKB88_04530, partial [Bryobacteraceae bacterium]|nr:hypothetical protein [Bryobacteraceae bacterium]